VAVVVAAAAAWATVAVAPANAALPSNDFFWDHAPTQWGLLQVAAPGAWAVSTGTGVTIGIVDSGIDAAHQDLVGKLVGGADCIGTSGDAAACQPGGGDVVGHGTHVAGIAAADTNNGLGVAGMAPDAHLLSARVVGGDGSGVDSDVGAGIVWAVDHGAQVINLSLGTERTTTYLGRFFSAGVEYAWSHGAIPVVAAGNAAGAPNYGSLDMVVVGATTPAGQVASYSNQLGSAKWGLVAPGGAADGNIDDDIVSTWVGNQYATMAGTSMAAAYVSGALALLLAQGMTPADAVQRLVATAAPCVRCGNGRVDAAAAVGAPEVPVLRPAAAPSAPEPGPANVVRRPHRAPAPAAAAPPRAAPATPAPVVVPVTPVPVDPGAATAGAPAPDGSLPAPVVTPVPVDVGVVVPRPAAVDVRGAAAVGAAALLAVVTAGLALGIGTLDNASRRRWRGT